MVTNSHGLQPANDGGTVRTIAIPKEMMGRLIPGKSLGDLLRDPFCGRVRGDVDPVGSKN
jgi:hypothetical protein